MNGHNPDKQKSVCLLRQAHAFFAENTMKTFFCVLENLRKNKEKQIEKHKKQNKEYVSLSKVIHNGL